MMFERDSLRKYSVRRVADMPAGLRHYVYLFLLVAVFFLPSVSFAATGFFYHDRCYASLSDVQQAVLSQGTIWNDSQQQPWSVYAATIGSNFVQVQYVDSAGAIVGTFNEYPPACTSNTPVTYNTDAEAWESVKTSAIVYYGLFVVCFLLGLRMGFLL